MTELMFAYDSGTCENEEAVTVANVGLIPCSIPDLRYFLPFVDENWCISSKEERGVEICYLAIPVVFVAILKIHSAVCNFFGCRSLSTPLWACNNHTSEQTHVVRYDFVYQPWFINNVMPYYMPYYHGL